MIPLTPCATLSTDTDPLLQQQQIMDSSHNFQPTVRSGDSTPDSARAPLNSDMNPGFTSGLFQNLDTGNAADTANNSGSQGRFYVPEQARQSVQKSQIEAAPQPPRPLTYSSAANPTDPSSYYPLLHLDHNIWPVGHNTPAFRSGFQDGSQNRGAHDLYPQQVADQRLMAMQAYQAQRTQQALFGNPQHGKTVHTKPLLMVRSWNSNLSSTLFGAFADSQLPSPEHISPPITLMSPWATFQNDPHYGNPQTAARLGYPNVADMHVGDWTNQDVNRYPVVRGSTNGDGGAAVTNSTWGNDKTTLTSTWDDGNGDETFKESVNRHQEAIDTPLSFSQANTPTTTVDTATGEINTPKEEPAATTTKSENPAPTLEVRHLIAFLRNKANQDTIQIQTEAVSKIALAWSKLTERVAKDHPFSRVRDLVRDETETVKQALREGWGWETQEWDKIVEDGAAVLGENDRDARLVRKAHVDHLTNKLGLLLAELVNFSNMLASNNPPTTPIAFPILARHNHTRSSNTAYVNDVPHDTSNNARIDLAFYNQDRLDDGRLIETVLSSIIDECIYTLGW